MEFKPIGHIESGFKFKNGTPRQPTVCGVARARLTINSDTYSNPEHSLEGLGQFSHVWVIFVFHKNNNPYKKAKVKPPRLNGARVGVFSTRSPYRLNPIGLTLARIESVEGATLHLSGVDMLDGTPVLDVKPYIPLYDQPQVAVTTSSSPQHIKHETNRGLNESEGASNLCIPEGRATTLDASVEDGHVPDELPLNTTDLAISSNHELTSTTTKPHSCVLEQFEVSSGKGSQPKLMNQLDSQKREIEPIEDDLPQSTVHDVLQGQRSAEEPTENNACSKKGSDVEFAQWIQTPPFHKLSVRWTSTAEHQLQQFSKEAAEEQYRLNFIQGTAEAKKAVDDILRGDPRSSYRRKKCVDRLYFFMVDVLHVTCWFNDDECVAEVVRIKPNREKMLQKLAGIH